MKNVWFKCLAKAAGMLTMFAVLVSQPPCFGHFHQPEVPEKLRTK